MEISQIDDLIMNFHRRLRTRSRLTYLHLFGLYSPSECYFIALLFRINCNLWCLFNCSVSDILLQHGLVVDISETLSFLTECAAREVNIILPRPFSLDLNEALYEIKDHGLSLSIGITTVPRLQCFKTLQSCLKITLLRYLNESLECFGP